MDARCVPHGRAATPTSSPTWTSTSRPSCPRCRACSCRCCSADVTRGIKRELISRAYNVLLRASLHVRFSDAQCGFKAVRRELVPALLARLEDDEWFFDTELLYHAERRQLSIREVPVRWIDDPDSRVDILATALHDLRGITRLRRAARGAESPASATTVPAEVRRAATADAEFDLASNGV